MKGFPTRRSLFLVSSLALAVSASNAFAGGYEKATLWDAKYSALAGAAVSSVNDSSAVYYNPAGLAFAEQNDVSLHISPTFSKFHGPASGSNNYDEGETFFSPVGGFTGLYRLNEKLTLGYGVYAVGGANAEYKDVTVGAGPGSLTGDYSTTIKIIETGLGLGYRIDNNWSVGGTYRLTHAYADLNQMTVAPHPENPTGPKVIGAQLGYNDMEGWNTFSIRLGTMYRSDDNRWGWGASYRSEMEVDAEGDSNFRTPQGTVSGKVTGTTAVPMQIATGVDYQLNPEWKLFGELTYSRYSDNDKITFKYEKGDAASVPVAQLNINWEDQYNFRVATEYTGIKDWALRGGYIYTTAVVPEEYATPTFSTPGNAHTITIGAGTKIMDETVALDFGADYNIVKNNNVKGGGVLATTQSGDVKAPSGKYKSVAYALHMSASYLF